MPSSATWCGARPVTSWSFQMSRPPLGGSMPQIRFNKVVLPEPLGPKMPTISPRAMLNETSATAVRPPKRLLKALTSKNITGAPHNAHNPAWQQQDCEDQNEAIGQHAELSRKFNNVG